MTAAIVSAPQAGSSWIARFLENRRAEIARRAVFKRTLRELSNLSQRELMDIGIAPSEIRRIAYQAAYDA